MKAAIYSAGFTLATCLSIAFGYSPDVPYYQQASMLFGGFCLGGVAVCIFES